MCKLDIAISFLACAPLILATEGQSTAQTRSGDVERIFARALQLHQAGDIEGAIREYLSVLALRPDRVDARSNLGAAYARLGRYHEAIEQYRQALTVEKHNPVIRFNLALAYYKAALLTEAAAELNLVVAAQPQNKNAVLLLADCHLQLGEHKKVIDLLTPLRAPYGDDRTLAYLLGTALIRDNQVDEGQLLVDRILRDGDSAEARVLIGSAHMMAHDYPSAIKEFERAIELNPKLPVAHSLHGQMLLRTGDREGAMRAFEAELAINANDFESNLYLGVLLKQEQRHEEALGRFERARTMRPRELNVRYFIGSVYLSMGKTAEAQRILEEVVNEAPDFVEAHVSLATAYYRLKRKEDGDRQRAIIEKLNAERQAQAPGAKEGLGPAYRGEKLPLVKPSPKQDNKQP